MHRTDSATTY